MQYGQYVLFPNLAGVSGCSLNVITEEHICVDVSCLFIISKVNTAIQSEKKKNRNEVTFQMFTNQKKTKTATENEKGQMAMFQLEKRLHYHSAGKKQYISRADHWISRLVGEGIWSIMKQPIDFPFLICRTWHKANGNFPPCVH